MTQRKSRQPRRPKKNGREALSNPRKLRKRPRIPGRLRQNCRRKSRLSSVVASAPKAKTKNAKIASAIIDAGVANFL